MFVNISFLPKSIVLNYQTQEMEFHGTLKYIGLDKKPENIWLWAYFFSPLSETGGSWADTPIKLINPFSKGNEVGISVAHYFHWWDNPFTPRSEWFARLNVSDLSADDLNARNEAKECLKSS